MSLYSHPQSGFGNVYPPQQQPSYVYNVPPAAVFSYGQPAYPMHYSDPSSFRREYTARLSELTMNSRPIIQNLSMMAQNYIRYADVVADCLQAHIRRVPPWMKLPAFYVLDAISKNVFEPYAAKFSTFVVPLFLDTFSQVDHTTRSKMEEMLVTWRTGAPSGKELFGVAIQVSLERQVWGSDSSSTIDNGTRRQGQSAPLTKSQVLAELDVTLALKEQAYNANPYDASAQNQINVLHQLRRMVEHGVTQEELKQILLQLRAMTRETSTVPPAIPPVQSTVSNTSVYAGPASHSSHHGYSSSIQSSSSSSSNVYPQVDNLTQTHNLPANATNVPSNISGISNLFQSLVKAGLVSGNNTPVGAGKESSTPQPSDEAKLQYEQTSEITRVESDKQYARNVFDMSIRLSTAEISRQRPRNVYTLYEAQPMKCKQCAMRFPEGNLGKKRMDEHLDMHFRQNRRVKDTGRGNSRSWFNSVQDWLSEPVDLKGKERESAIANDKVTDINTSTEAHKRNDALRASVVVVPPGDEAKTVHCPVCKEAIKSEFQEDEEEWIWRNALQVKDKIYHATCHAELATSNTLAQRLRVEGITSSRAGTPEAVSSQETPFSTPKGKGRLTKSPSPNRVLQDVEHMVGIKRKALEAPISSDSDDQSETPPSKKLVLSTT